MHNNSNKSKGYEPVSSGPNMTGYYMGESPNLINMMQEGGLTPMSSYQRSFGARKVPGSALLARALKQQEDLSLLEDFERAEAKRQQRAGLFGSVGGLATGLLGAALTPFTGGASLALVSGLGTSLGKRVGEELGAGRPVDYDQSGTVFAQKNFRDVDQSSREFTRGMNQRALISGLSAATTSLISPDGGIYGKVSGRLNPSSMSSLTEFSSGVAPTASGSVVPASADAEMLGDVVVPEFDTSLTDVSDMVTQPTIDAYEASLAGATSLGEQNALLDAARTAQGAQATAEEASRSAGSLMGYLQRQELGPLADFSLRKGSSSSMDPSLAEAVSPYFNLPMAPNRAPSMGTPSDASFLASYLNKLPRFENGGLIGMQTGGVTARSVLEEQGLAPTQEQLDLIDPFDVSGVEDASKKIGQDITQQVGDGLASVMNSSFGKQSTAVQDSLGRAEQSYQDFITGEKSAFASDTLKTATQLIGTGAEIQRVSGPPTSPPASSFPNASWFQKSPDGTKIYVWNGSQWKEQE